MLAIKNAKVLDGRGTSPVKGNVLIEDGAIVAVGADAKIPEDATVIEADGFYAIPGLIDAHTHFGGTEAFDRPGASYRYKSYDYDEAREGFVKWGVTTVRTCGDLCPDILEFRDNANAGRIVSPRVIACGPFIQAKNGHPTYTVYMSSQDVIDHACYTLDENDDVEGTIQKIADTGVDWIKIFYAHVNKMEYPKTAPRMPYSVIERIVKKSHELGLPVVCHIDGPAEMYDMAKVGVDTIEHVINVGDEPEELTDDMVKTIADSGIPCDVTLVATYNHAKMMKDLPDVSGLAKQFAQKLRAAGVHVMVGCDSGIPAVPFGESLHDEMANLVDVGYSPAEVINMTTYGNAEGLKIADKVGSIEPGKYGDVVLLGADPTADIANTKDVKVVIREGKIIYDGTEL